MDNRIPPPPPPNYYTHPIQHPQYPPPPPPSFVPPPPHLFYAPEVPPEQIFHSIGQGSSTRSDDDDDNSSYIDALKQHPDNLLARLGDYSTTMTASIPNTQQQLQQFYATLAALSQTQHTSQLPSFSLLAGTKDEGSQTDTMPPFPSDTGIPSALTTVLRRSNHPQLISAVHTRLMALPIPPPRSTLAGHFDHVFGLTTSTSQTVTSQALLPPMTPLGITSATDAPPPQTTLAQTATFDTLSHLTWYLLDLLGLYTILRIKLQHLDNSPPTTPGYESIRNHYQQRIADVTHVFHIITNPFHQHRAKFNEFLTKCKVNPSTIGNGGTNTTSSSLHTFSIVIDVMTLYIHVLTFNRSCRFLHFIACHSHYLDILTVAEQQQEATISQEAVPPPTDTTPQGASNPALTAATTTVPSTITPATAGAGAGAAKPAIRINIGGGIPPRPGVGGPAQPLSIGIGNAPKPRLGFPSINIGGNIAKPGGAIGAGGVAAPAIRIGIGIGGAGAGAGNPRPPQVQPPTQQPAKAAAMFDSDSDSSDSDQDGIHPLHAQPTRPGQPTRGGNTSTAQQPFHSLFSSLAVTPRGDDIRLIQFQIPSKAKGYNSDDLSLLSYLSFGEKQSSTTAAPPTAEPISFLGNMVTCYRSIILRKYFIDDAMTMNTVFAYERELSSIISLDKLGDNESKLVSHVTTRQRLIESNWNVYSTTSLSDKVICCHELFANISYVWQQSAVFPLLLLQIRPSPSQQPVEDGRDDHSHHQLVSQTFDMITSKYKTDNLYITAFPPTYDFTVTTQLVRVIPELASVALEVARRPHHTTIDSEGRCILEYINHWTQSLHTSGVSIESHLGSIARVLRTQASILYSMLGVFVNELHFQRIVFHLTRQFITCYSVQQLVTLVNDMSHRDLAGGDPTPRTPICNIIHSLNQLAATFCLTFQFYNAIDILSLHQHITDPSGDAVLGAISQSLYTSTPSAALLDGMAVHQSDSVSSSSSSSSSLVEQRMADIDDYHIDGDAGSEGSFRNGKPPQPPLYHIISAKMYASFLPYYTLHLRNPTTSVHQGLSSGPNSGAKSHVVAGSTPVATPCYPHPTRFVALYHLQLFLQLMSPMSLLGPRNSQDTNGPSNASNASHSSRSRSRTLDDIKFAQEGVKTIPNPFAAIYHLTVDPIATTTNSSSTMVVLSHPHPHPDTIALHSQPPYVTLSLLLSLQSERSLTLFKHAIQQSFSHDHEHSSIPPPPLHVKGDHLVRSHPQLLQLLTPTHTDHVVMPFPINLHMNKLFLSSLQSLMEVSHSKRRLNVSAAYTQTNDSGNTSSDVNTTQDSHSSRHKRAKIDITVCEQAPTLTTTEQQEAPSKPQTAYQPLNPFYIHPLQQHFEQSIALGVNNSFSMAQYLLSTQLPEATPALEVLLEEVELIKALTDEEEAMLRS